jgi:predicted transcriptional regulator
MQKTTSNHAALVRYLNFLQHAKLMEIHHSETSYLTTPKGSEFVEKFKQLQKHAAFQT